MKKIILIILTGLLVYGCGEKGQDKSAENQKDQFKIDSTDIKTVPVEQQNQSFYLRYKLGKDNTYNYRLTAISKDEQSITSKDTSISQALNQTIIYNIKFRPTEIDADSTMEIETVITSIKLDGKYGDEPAHYQSGAKIDSADRVKYSQYESLIQNPFTVRISKIGELLDVFRTDKIVNTLLDIGGYKDSLKTEEKSSLRNNITEGLLKPLISQIFRKLPEEKVAKDSLWKVEQPATQMMVFQAQNTSLFKITGLGKLEDDMIANVEAGLKTKIEGKNKITDRGINYDFDNPVTAGGGQIYFNITKGLLQKAKLNTSIKFSFRMESAGQKGSRKETISNTNILEYIP